MNNAEKHQRETKVCNVCEVEKSVEEFNADKSIKGGKRGICRPCQRSYNASYRNTREGRLRRAFHVAKARAKKAGAEDKLTFEELKGIYYLAENNGCPYCGNPLGDKFSVEHIVPFSTIGKNEISNVLITHEKCNLSKGQKPLAKALEDAGKVEEIRARMWLMKDGPSDLDEFFESTGGKPHEL